MRGYLLAAEDYPADDVEAAVDMLVKGTAPGVNPSFRPKPSEFGAECHRQNHLRADKRARDKFLALPPPVDRVIPDDERERVKAGFDKLIEDLSAKIITDDAGDARRRKAIFDKTNARFYPDGDEAAA